MKMKLIYLTLAVCFVSAFAEFEQTEYKVPNVQDAFDKVLTHIESLISKLDDSSNAKLKELIEKLKGLLPNIAGKLDEKIKAVLEKISKLKGTSETEEEVDEARILDKLKELTTHVQDLIVSIVTNLVSSVGKREEKTSLLEKVKGIAKQVLEALMKLKEKFQEKLGKREIEDVINRGVLDFLKNTLGLSAVWDEIKNLGNSVLGELLAIAAKLMFAGSQKLSEAKDIFSKLATDLTNHAGDAGSLVAAAIAALKGIVGNKREIEEVFNRGVIDFLKNTLGLSAVWDEIKNLGNSVLGELLAIGAKLMFAGTQKLSEAKDIFSKLVTDLTNHAGDAGSLVAAAIAALKGIVGN